MSNLKSELTGCGLGEFPSTISLNLLVVNKEYKVMNLRWIKTTYGKTMVVTLDGVGQAFLPKRFASAFKNKTEEDFQEVISSGLKLIYRGEKEFGRFKTPIIEFI